MTELLALLQLSDPALPIGSFSHSAALETYVQYGVVKNGSEAASYIEAQLSLNLRYTDAAFVSLAYDAAVRQDLKALLEMDEECSAVKLPREMREASQKLGLRLLKIMEPLCEDAFLRGYRQAVAEGQALGHYCLAFGAAAAALSTGKKQALTGFFYNAAAGIVTNAVKLVPLGQQEGQQILFSMQELIGSLVELCMEPDRALIGLSCPGFDIRSMQHERLYSRLYMS